MTPPLRYIVPALARIMTGCSSVLSGLGGKDTYACKAPPGAMCTSISGVHANTSLGGTRPVLVLEQKGTSFTRPTPWGTTTPPDSAPRNAASATGSASALRSPPRLLRIWIAPWEDSDGDLHEAAFLHVVVDSGRWLVEHVRPPSTRERDGAIAPAAVPEQRVRDDSRPAAPSTFGPTLTAPAAPPASGTRKER